MQSSTLRKRLYEQVIICVTVGIVLNLRLLGHCLIMLAKVRGQDSLDPLTQQVR